MENWGNAGGLESNDLEFYLVRLEIIGLPPQATVITIGTTWTIKSNYM